MKKLIALLMFVTMFLSTMSLAYAQADQASSWAEEAITFMESENAVPQTLLGGYKTAITRSEFASLIVKVVESKLNTSLPYDSNIFTDTNAMDINKAYKLKIVNGVGNQRFDPDGLIKREEIAIMFVNTLKALDELEPSKEHLVKTTFELYFNDADLISSWALSSIQLAYNNGIISGVGNDSFNPKGSATREQAIVIAHKVWTNLDNEDHIPSLKLKFASNLLDHPTVESEQIEEQAETADLESAVAERFEYNGRYYPQHYWLGETEEIARENFKAMYTLAMKSESDIWFVEVDKEYLKAADKDELIGTEMEYVTLLNGDEEYIVTALKQNLISESMMNLLKPFYMGHRRIEEQERSANYNSRVVYEDYLDKIRQDEFLYTAITQDILTKYPIMFKGTPEQKKQNQLNQILELNRWFVYRTDYGNDLKYAEATEDRYSMGLLSMLYTNEHPYGTLPIDEVFSEKDRTAPPEKYLEYEYPASTDEYKRHYFEHHKLETEKALKLAEYFRTSNSTFVGYCGGYAELFKAVARQMGIDTEYIGAGSHAWNIVRFADGSIIHFDETQADQGFQSIEVIPMSGRTDSRKHSLQTDNRLIEMGTSKDRLLKVLGEARFGGYDTVPTGDAWAVFGTEANWNKFYDAFHINKGNTK